MKRERERVIENISIITLRTKQLIVQSAISSMDFIRPSHGQMTSEGHRLMYYLSVFLLQDIGNN